MSSRRDLLAQGAALRDGRIIIDDVLGSGGEGVVYKAFDRMGSRTVALKVLHVDDAESIPQLKREFRFLRDLIHPRLVQLHELVVERELSYFTMAFVEGADFLEVARDPESIRALALQLADVLSFLHQTGRVHRDVKPSNILVRKNGELVLLDFGIGLDRGMRRPRQAAPVGTPRYMAPEVISMKGATEKSDAYSVGILLFEALTGAHPNASERVDPTQRRPFDPSREGVETPADLRALVMGLTHPDPELRAGIEDTFSLLIGDETRPSGVHRIQRAASPQQGQEGYTGRTRELARLGEAFARMESGYRPVLVHLEAPSGMGKTALLDHYLEGMTDALVFRGRCSEHEKVPHKAIDGVVEDLVEYLLEQTTEDVMEILPYGDAEILLQLFPEMSRVPLYEELGPRSSLLGDHRAMRHRAYLALASTFARLALRESLIIAIDDLQWGDLDSGKLLAEVFAGADKPHCLLILAYRSEEKQKSPCLAEIFRRKLAFADEMVSTSLVLEPLSPTESRQLVVELLGKDVLSPQIVDQVVQESAGSPLLLSEIATHLEHLDPGERSAHGWGIADIVAARRQQLSASAATGFGLLCCAGARTDVSFLAELSGAEPDALALELGSLRLARAREGGTRLEPFHDAIREAYLKQAPDDCTRLHGVIAEALVQRTGDPAEIARHFAAAGDDRVSVWAERAADTASAAFALASAIEFYELALVSGDVVSARRASLLERFADVLAAAGHGAKAGPIYAALAQEANVDSAISLRRRAAEQLLITGQAHEGSAVVAEVQKEAGLVWPKTAAAALRALLRHRLALGMSSAASGKVMPKPRASALPEAKQARLNRQLAACRAAWPTSFISTIHGAANSSLYLRLALKSGDREHLAYAYAMEAGYLASEGTRARPASARLMTCARDLMPTPNEGYNAAFLFFCQAQVDYLLGDLKKSIESYDVSEELFLKHGRNVSWELNSGRILHSDALFYLGRHREVDTVFAAWTADARERGDSYLNSALTLARAPRLILRNGSREEALAEIEAGAAGWKSPYVGYHHLSEIAVRTYVEIYSGRPERGLEHMDAIKGAMRKSFMNQVHVARVQIGNLESAACLERAADLPDGSERRGLLRRARKIAERMLRENAAWATAYGLQTSAIASLIEAQTEEALATLRQAGALFAQCEMRLYAAAVDARLGELIGGDEGKTLVTSAHAAFETADVCNWVKSLSCHTPRVLPR